MLLQARPVHRVDVFMPRSVAMPSDANFARTKCVSRRGLDILRSSTAEQCGQDGGSFWLGDDDASGVWEVYSCEILLRKYHGWEQPIVDVRD